MRRGYHERKWRRRLETLHRRAVAIAQEVEEYDPTDDRLPQLHQAHIWLSELCNFFAPERPLSGEGQ